MPVPSTPQDLINLIREKLFNNTSGKIDEPSIREVLEWMVKVLDAKFSFFSPTLTEEQYAQWNLMLDYMLRETKGVLTTTSPAPTGASAKGKYILSGPGTYTNLGGLVTTADKLNYAYFDGTTWSLIAVEVTNSNGNSSEGELINFSPNIYFNKNLAIASKTINAPITFIPTVNGDAILGGSTLVRLIADGTNFPNFSNFKKLNGSQDYSNVSGTLNACYFFYDGIDAWVNIWQGIGSSNIVTNDTTPPSAPTLTSSSITSDSVILSWSGATDNVGVTSFEIYKDGVLLETVSSSPYTVTGLTATTNYAFTVKAKDTAGNTSISSNSVNITTTAKQFENVIFDSLSGATYNTGTNRLTSSSAGTGGLLTTPISGDFEVFSDGTITYASVIALKQNTTGGYNWTGLKTVSFLISAFLIEGLLSVTINSNTTKYEYQLNTTDRKIKLKRLGVDCQILTSSDGVNWNLRYTETGIFTGVPNVYIQGIFAVNQSNSMGLKKSF